MVTWAFIINDQYLAVDNTGNVVIHSDEYIWHLQAGLPGTNTINFVPTMKPGYLLMASNTQVLIKKGSEVNDEDAAFYYQVSSNDP